MHYYLFFKKPAFNLLKKKQQMKRKYVPKILYVYIYIYIYIYIYKKYL